MIQWSSTQGNQSEIAQFVQQNQSEVARFLQQYELEVEAMQQGLNGLTLGMAQHAFITHRMETFLSKTPIPSTQQTPSVPDTTACIGPPLPLSGSSEG